MGLFSKKRKTVEVSQEVEDNSSGELENPSPNSELVEERASAPASPDNTGTKDQPAGPLDVKQLADQDTSQYADFGVFLLPQIPGLAVHPESPLDEKTFGSLTMQIGKAAVELLAVAAPKSKRLWPELRAQVRGETTAAGNTCDERVGSFGTELFVQLAAQDAQGNRGRVQVRYCGVDGPNWFVRLVFNGMVQAEDPDLQALEQAVRQVVVVRGSRPMSPRSVIPVVLPDDLARQLASLREQQA
ncbi:DUF3710 domain-containing protein [uncultured Mobiluncus sp.]|uniref:DUF3710 domain-containing protein n=1 Tax=uncultured Mobiluncus sp. TaxID=293425 RepID=UPI00288C0A6C|nr:DUF3710 domain-containing protein [uncultured Mobiluncus sp.]